MHEAKVNQPDFGRAVRRYRQERGMSQIALGDELGISQWTISRIEKGYTDKGIGVERLTVKLSSIDDERSEISEISSRVASSEEFEALVRRILAESRA